MDIARIKDKPWLKDDSVIKRLRIPCTEAELAIRFLEKWGMIAGKEDGEDSVGRSKIRLLTEEEIVERACKSSDLMCKEAEKRGWFLHIDPDEGEEHPPL
ncbi:MAG: hypothetical protein V3U97_05455 [bacterium]